MKKLTQLLLQQLLCILIKLILCKVPNYLQPMINLYITLTN